MSNVADSLFDHELSIALGLSSIVEASAKNLVNTPPHMLAHYGPLWVDCVTRAIAAAEALDAHLTIAWMAKSVRNTLDAVEGYSETLAALHDVDLPNAA
jgi:hypothetical protein